MQIFVIDDDESIRRMLKRQLKKLNFEVVMAENGTQALEMLKTITPDVVLLDQMMPNMDGMTVFEKIKKKRGCPPVIMLTAHGSLNLAVAFMKSGGADFAQKPVDMDVLEIKIRKAAEKALLQDKLEILGKEKAQLSTLLETAAKLNHEINNPLNIIFNAIPRIKGLPEDSPYLAKIDYAMKSIEKVVMDINREVETKKKSFQISGDFLEEKIKDKICLVSKEKD